MEKNILLSISVMVSGGRDDMWKCLDSLSGIRKELSSELIITDTGCNEKTHERLETYADKLIKFNWCNDFAAARNAGLKIADGQWFMFLDDDEWFDDTKNLVRFFKSGEYKKYKSGAYLIRNYKDFEGVGYLDSWITRLFERTPGVRFYGRIHEIIVPFEGPTAQIKDFVHHYGYLYKNEAEAIAHYERNRVLLEKMIEEEPDVPRWRVHICQEYMSHAFYDELLKAACDGIASISGKKDDDCRVAAGTFYAAKYLSFYARGMHDEALLAAEDGLCDERLTQMGRAFLCVSAARECMVLAGEAGDLSSYDACASYIKKATDYINEYWQKLKWLDDHERQKFFQSNSVFTRNYATGTNVCEAHFISLCTALFSGDEKSALDHLNQIE